MYVHVLQYVAVIHAVLTRRDGWRVWPLQSLRERMRRSIRHGVKYMHIHVYTCTHAGFEIKV